MSVISTGDLNEDELEFVYKGHHFEFRTPEELKLWTQTTTVEDLEFLINNKEEE